ncbi:MAG: HAD family phosphatase [Candidatus Aureabacteria bacterium]|nr:HAD family phosphatase [Candidatus Auribacterota bacterium]
MKISGKEKKIKAVIFDWGGVLIDNPAPGLLKYCSQEIGVSRIKLASIFSRLKDPFQKGTLPEKSLWEKIRRDMNVSEETVNCIWGNAFREVYSEKKEVFSLVEALQKSGYVTAILSNTELSAVKFFEEKKYSMFDVKIFSCLEKTIKPEPLIYKITLDRLKLDPAECLFIDDKKINVSAAKKAGMKAILFRNVRQLKKNLRAYSVSWD